MSRKSDTSTTEMTMAVDEKGEKAKELKDVILDKLDDQGNGGLWLWTLFVLCLTPNIINGFHVSSYVFFSQMPDNYYCVPLAPNLQHQGWSLAEIRNVSLKNGTQSIKTCTILDFDYAIFKNMSYLDAAKYKNQHQHNVSEVSCLNNKQQYRMVYDQEADVSMIPEWDLICENTALRSTVQVALSIGKFFGATLFGILSDQYGRKSSFSVATIVYIISGVMVTFSPWYLLVLLGRVGIGAAGSGVFYSAFTLLTENIGPKHRSWMSIAFNFSYPIGMIILALTAYYIHPWRELSLALAIPAFFLLFHLYFLVESPRWLLSKGYENRAYRMVFGKKIPAELRQLKKEVVVTEKKVDDEEATLPWSTRLKQKFSILTSLYGPARLRNRALICHYTWCVTSLCYYVTALNATNLSANLNVYVATTGFVDICGYIVSMIALAYLGRKSTSCALFALAGISLLTVLGIDPNQKQLIFVLAMVGRLGIVSVYAVMTLHTAELFPTEIRNTALGISSTCAHVGSIAAPYIVDILGVWAWFIPTTICGICILSAGIFTLLQPETKGRELRDHVQEEQEPVTIAKDGNEMELMK